MPRSGAFLGVHLGSFVVQMSASFGTAQLQNMAYEFKITRRVEFSETDMAGIVHYSNFFKYMETAEHAFYRSLGFSVVAPAEVEGESVGWPRVHAECDYYRPLRFEDTVEIHLLVRELREKSIGYDFIFRRLEPEPVIEVARGAMAVVSVVFDATLGRMRAVPLPAAIAQKMEPAPESSVPRNPQKELL